MTDDLNDFKEAFKEENERIKQFLDAKREIKEQRKRLGYLHLMKMLPYPRQAIGLVILLGVLVVILHYFPQSVDYVTVNWIPKGLIDARALFLITVGWALLATALLILTHLFGGPVKTFLLSRLKNKDIYELYHKSGRKQYLIPKEEIAGVVELTDDKAVQPDSSAFYSGPNGRRMTSCVPELPVTFSPRKLLENAGLGLDMMMLKVYGIKHEQKQWEKMKTGKEWMMNALPFVGIMIAILITVTAVFGPYFWAKMGDMDEGKHWRTEYETCRVDMLNKGIIPLDYQTTTTTLPPKSTENKEAFMGISLKNT